jgi:PAS domain S-box-containing protein
MSRRLNSLGRRVRIGDPAGTSAIRPSSFRVAFEQAPFGMCYCDLTGNFVHVNRRFCEMTGYAEPELVGRNFTDITHPDDLDSSRQSTEDLRAGLRETVSLEKRYIRRSGETVWSRTTLVLAHARGRGASHIIVTAEDITPQRQAEDRLAASEQRNAEIMTRISDGYFVLSRDWIYTDLNARAAEMVGRTRDQLLGRRIWDLFPDAEHSVWRQRYEQVMQTGVPC